MPPSINPRQRKAFNFRQQQQRARTATIWLVLAFCALVLLIGATIGFGSAWAFSAYMGYSADTVLDLRIALWISAGTASIIILASCGKLLLLRGDGGRIAESLGGEEVQRGAANPLHKRYLNVVEEMALAAGMPIPKAYVLRNETGINAFAAGDTPDRSAVAVTQGALEILDREELAGVIAHEMAHVANADTRLNSRLLSLVFGLVSLSMIGRIIAQSIRQGRSSSSKGNVVAFLLIVAIMLLVLGFLGSLAGRLLQSMISRRRELLADATAVQYTRNPEGLVRALKKIGVASRGSVVDNAHAEEARHMFFASSMKPLFGLMATHPPLVMRIRLLEPDFDPLHDVLWNANEIVTVHSSRQLNRDPWGTYDRSEQR